MPDYQVKARKVADIGPAPRIIHDIGAITQKNRLHSCAHHLAQAERPAKHTHVGVHPAKHDVPYALLLEDVPDNIPLCGNIVIVIDLQLTCLPKPRCARIPALLLKLCRPLCILPLILILTPSTVVSTWSPSGSKWR